MNAVEIMARAVRDALPACGVSDALASAQLSALLAAGYRILPVEPTEEMGAAGFRAHIHDPLSGRRTLSEEEADAIGWSDKMAGKPSRWVMPVYRAMLAAHSRSEPGA